MSQVGDKTLIDKKRSKRGSSLASRKWSTLSPGTHVGLGRQTSTLYLDTKREISFKSPLSVYNAVISHASFHGTSTQVLKQGKGSFGRGRVRTLPVHAKTVSEAMVY